FRCNDAERKQLGFLRRANFLDDLRERDLGSALFVGAEQLPLREINSVKQMETMPSFLRNERSVFVGHHASVRLPKLWSSERRKSLPPGSARVSRALPGALAAQLRRRFGLAQMRDAVFLTVARHPKLQIWVAHFGRSTNCAPM